MPKSIQERKRELKEKAKVKSSTSRMEIHEVDHDLIIAATIYERDGYISYEFTSSVHWTDVVSVTQQQISPDEYQVSVNYASGGTLISDPILKCKAMRKIFTLAEKTAVKLQ